MSVKIALLGKPAHTYIALKQLLGPNPMDIVKVRFQTVKAVEFVITYVTDTVLGLFVLDYFVDPQTDKRFINFGTQIALERAPRPTVDPLCLGVWPFLPVVGWFIGQLGWSGNL